MMKMNWTVGTCNKMLCIWLCLSVSLCMYSNLASAGVVSNNGFVNANDSHLYLLVLLLLLPATIYVQLL